MVELSKIKVNTGSNFEQICPYAVGGIYLSLTRTSPATLFGGTWASIGGDYFLRAVDTTNAYSSQTGGSSSVTHSHWMPFGMEFSDGGAFTTTGWKVAADGWTNRVFSAYGYNYFAPTGWSTSNGGTQSSTYNTSISTIPPYYTVYAWRRTA